MRVISPPSLRGADGASVFTVTDYHPARVFRGLQVEKQLGHNPPIQLLDSGRVNTRPAPVPIPGRDPRAYPYLQYALYTYSSHALEN